MSYIIVFRLKISIRITKAGIYSRQLKSNLGKLYSSPEFCSSLDPYYSHYFG
jgi:hypothetical protein